MYIYIYVLIREGLRNLSGGIGSFVDNNDDDNDDDEDGGLLEISHDPKVFELGAKGHPASVEH